MSLQKWQELLSRVEVIDRGESIEIFSESDLSKIEAEHNIRFPTDYKLFCQVFGTGTFNDFVSLFCPRDYLFEDQQVMTEGMIQQLKKHPSADTDRDREYISLLNSSFQFGDNTCASALILWDLRSYSEIDDSYDIYWAPWEMPEVDNPIKIGRNFFEFVQDFCLGNQAYEILPDPENECPETMSYIFERFKP